MSEADKRSDCAMNQDPDIKEVLRKLRAEVLSQQCIRDELAKGGNLHITEWENSHNFCIWEMCRDAHYTIVRLDLECDILRNLANAGWYIARGNRVPEDDKRIEEFRDDLHRALDKLKMIKLEF